MPAVLITGASRGFGRALVEVYARRGWTLFPLVRDGAIAAGLEASAGAACHPVVADVATDRAEHEIARVLGDHCEALDVLVNNAGHIIKLRGLRKTTPEDLEALFRVHCVGAFRCTRAALPFLKRARKPVVIDVTSRWGSIGRTLTGLLSGIYSYQIAKCAQNMLTACLDMELKKEGIRAFAVHPGRLRTEVAPPDADVDPDEAAEALAGWIDRIDERTPCGFHDLMGKGLIEW